MSNQEAKLNQLVSRIKGLYSLPAVAMEVVQLTDRPGVDTQSLKSCLEKDPALTAKVLRVVNSSMFGLSGEVADLNQALALLGSEPLKMLVLGFSLPDQLFEGVAADRLQWYWTRTLTRAVGARQVSETLFNQAGDEALVAGMLHDIGVLALMQELGPAYATFLSHVIGEGGDLAQRERESIGFTNLELGAALLTQWKIPQRLVDAIAISKQHRRIARKTSEEYQLAKILHLADLMAQLVGGRRLQALPELMEAGDAYCGLTKPQLIDIVGQLQPQVDQLAEVLSLQLPAGRDYGEVLKEAQSKLVQLKEDTTGRSAQSEPVDSMCQALWKQSQELTEAMESFLEKDRRGRMTTSPSEESENQQWESRHAPHQRTMGEQDSANGGAVAPASGHELLMRPLVSAARGCRMRRDELSLLLIEVDNFGQMQAHLGEMWGKHISKALERVCRRIDHDSCEVILMSPERVAIVLPNCERRQAVVLANEAVDQLVHLADQQGAPEAMQGLTFSAGSATAAGILKNFSTGQLVESAERCLSAARSCGGSAVKSIEIY